jgi:mRNA-degrading endonuclease RelE of RelBE toxin-antitoxin system
MAAPYEILWLPVAEAERDELRPYDQRRIMSAVALLAHQAETIAKNRKPLEGIPEYPSPLWEVRVGEHRVLYHVEALDKTVLVLGVRLKGRLTTEEIL